MWASVARLVSIGVSYKQARHFSQIMGETHVEECEDASKCYRTTDDKAVSLAAKLVKLGGVIAVPTDTIYGIAASAQSSTGIEKLYSIKKRDIKKPIAICVASIQDVSLWGDTSVLPQGLLSSLLPGQVTVVLKRTEALNARLNPDSQLVGIRVPDNKFILDIVKCCKVPLALTSANLSNEPSSLNPLEFKHLWPCLDGVFDGGQLGLNDKDRLGSTVVDLSVDGCYKLIRSGSALQYTIKTLTKFHLKELIVE